MQGLQNYWFQNVYMNLKVCFFLFALVLAETFMDY